MTGTAARARRRRHARGFSLVADLVANAAILALVIVPLVAAAMAAGTLTVAPELQRTTKINRTMTD